jgi:hypothetical protein
MKVPSLLWDGFLFSDAGPKIKDKIARIADLMKVV